MHCGDHSMPLSNAGRTVLGHAEAAKTLDLLRPYVAFNAKLRSSFSALIQRLGLACASLLRQQVCSWVLMS